MMCSIILVVYNTAALQHSYNTVAYCFHCVSLVQHCSKTSMFYYYLHYIYCSTTHQHSKYMLQHHNTTTHKVVVL